jgi:hypothetical protein
MFRAFIAVVIELWEFSCETAGVRRESKSSLPKVVSHQESEIKSFQRVSHAGQLAYVIGNEVPLFKQPIVAFDNQVAMVSFPYQVEVQDSSDTFTRVRAGDMFGWITTSSLQTNLSEVEPQLTSGTVYGPDHRETTKIRQYLNDACFGQQLQLPLQPTEYLFWQLKGVINSSVWSGERPRLPGTWQNILKGKTSVHIGTEPKTASVMEYYADKQTGVLSYVEAVHPDMAIIISSVGRNKEGEYTKETMTNLEWRELRPVFISFN